VAGSVGDADYYSHAALWTPHHSHGTTGTWTELGVLPGGDGSVARGINGQGTVVGQSTSALGDRGFVYDGRLHSLPTLPGGTESFAYAVDPRGVVVGYADGAGTHGDRAVVWRHRQATDLNTYLPARACEAGYRLLGAYDINGRGQIVGVATIDGHAHGFLLTPRSTLRHGGSHP
jgi:probable HAF family extracellular repeat protein